MVEVFPIHAFKVLSITVVHDGLEQIVDVARILVFFHVVVCRMFTVSLLDFVHVGQKKLSLGGFTQCLL